MRASTRAWFSGSLSRTSDSHSWLEWTVSMLCWVLSWSVDISSERAKISTVRTRCYWAHRICYHCTDRVWSIQINVYKQRPSTSSLMTFIYVHSYNSCAMVFVYKSQIRHHFVTLLITLCCKIHSNSREIINSC